MLISELRSREFSRLDESDHAYLDYTGAALHPGSLVDEHAAMLRGAVLGNPHSESQASLASSALLCEARERVRRFFHADDYEVVFTANASGAVRLVAESFPFAPEQSFVLTADNHNSVNGIREYARRAGARVTYVAMDAELRIGSTTLPDGPGLFAVPAQSNFSGVKHSMEHVARARARGHQVLLDAAAFVPTSTLDLRTVRPEFVALSFYKMFGYPTGVGALLARTDALATLRRPWFAGGTVEHVRLDPPQHELREGPEAFEDGTVNFQAIGAIPAGLSWLAKHGVEQIGAHALSLARRLDEELGALRYRNGRAMVTLYGPRDWSSRGAVVTFNVRAHDGSLIAHEVVEAAAREARVSVRGGCFCNPGAAEALGLGFGALVPGAVRASLGAASNERDVERLVHVIAALAGTAGRSSPSRALVQSAPPAPRVAAVAMDRTARMLR
ncbi:MAG: aminotransferase class V-fold PLP-dependent enzyme [Gemmatimonadaceae bacterium]